MPMTKLENLINPEVMADMISGTIEKTIVVTPFAKVDTTLQGRPGDTITIPKYAYIGDAGEVAEGEEVTPEMLTASTTEVTVKKAMKAVTLSDEAVLSGYGNPVGEANAQISKAIAGKVDEDAMNALQSATLSYSGTDIISYSGIVDAIDLFEEEFNSEKVMFVHPKQMTQLRKDEQFISADKYSGDVIMKGEVGMIANCRIVMTKRVPVKSSNYINPIVKLNNDDTVDDAPAITIYIKRDTNVETERHTLSRTTDISADKIYTVALSNASKVVLAKFKQTSVVSS